MCMVCTNVLGVAPAALALLTVSLSDLKYSLAISLDYLYAGYDKYFSQMICKRVILLKV